MSVLTLAHGHIAASPVPSEMSPPQGGVTLIWISLEGLPMAWQLVDLQGSGSFGGMADLDPVLQFRRPGSTLAQARDGRSLWSFKRCGFMDPRVSLRLEGSSRDAGMFVPRGQGTAPVDGLLQVKGVGIALIARGRDSLDLYRPGDVHALASLGFPAPGVSECPVMLDPRLEPGKAFLAAAFLWYLQLMELQSLADRAISERIRQGQDGGGSGWI